jgi:geranylgeranyl pyrophosphate synthase
MNRRYAVPQKKEDREHILSIVKAYVRSQSLVPPLSLNVLKKHVGNIHRESLIPLSYIDFTTVLLANSIWEQSVSEIPYERRLLLIPQCLRSKSRCPAVIDEFGLLCEQCGCCATGNLMSEAEKLGYVVLVAEGTTVVTQLLESGQIEAVIGVGCLESLERTFDYVIAGAIPSLAIPLYKTGCENTKVDIDWVKNAIYLKDETNNDKQTHSIDIGETRRLVQSWFTNDCLRKRMSMEQNETEEIAIQSLLSGGKRWRPILTTSVYRALMEGKTIPSLMDVSFAVECFHKASLIHDDIEDEDDSRYGKPTLHCEEGMPVALNVGDFLQGEGYRLLGNVNATTDVIIKLINTAAHGHRKLSLGQGGELIQKRSGQPASVDQTLDIFRLKTAPAFEVALNLGAILAEADDGITNLLFEYSQVLGVAYQIKDDIEDIEQDMELNASRPSLVVSMAWEIWCSEDKSSSESFSVASFYIQFPKLIREHDLIEKAWSLFDRYKTDSLDVLSALSDQRLKTLLFQLTFKILGGVAFQRKRNQLSKNALKRKEA